MGVHSSVKSFTVTGLTNDTSYSFKIQTLDKSGNVAAGETKACIAGGTSFPLGYVKVAGGTIEGKTNENNYESVFIYGRR